MARTIKAVIGRPKGKTTTEIQTFIFPKDDWKDGDAVKSWLKGHDKDSALDETEDSYRARQEDPGKFQSDSFRTITITENATELTDESHDIHIDIGEGHVDKVEKTAELSDAYGEVDLDEKTDEDHAKVGSGDTVHRSDFAFVGDPEVKSTWKYPIHDASHVRNALARWGQHKGIPQDKESGVLAKILKAARKFKVEYDPEKYSALEAADIREMVPSNPKSYVRVQQIERHWATYLSSVLPDPVERDGRALFRVPIAVTGKWFKDDHSFSITTSDLRDMVRNFDKRENRMVTVDYEHASENPEVARGAEVPAAGWIHHLLIHTNGKTALLADIEWTEKAKGMIRNSEYRFFSPAIDFGFRDKRTGECQGATLTSGALTNHPFLEELPPIHLSYISRPAGLMLCSDLMTSKGAKTMAKKFEEMEAADFKGLPKVLGAKIPAGKPHSGHIGLRHGESGDLVGYMTKGHLGDLADKHLPEGDDDECPDDMEAAERQEEMTRRSLRGKKAGEEAEEMRQKYEEMRQKYEEATQRLEDLRKGRAEEATEVQKATEKVTERVRAQLLSEIGYKDGKPPEVKKAVELGRQQLALEGKRLLLREACADGELDKSKAAVLAANANGTISTPDYVAVESASSAVKQACREGKILPYERMYHLRTAIERPSEFAEWLKDALPKVRMDVVGSGEAQAPSVDDEVSLHVKRALSEHPEFGGDYARAHSHVMRSIPGLRERYNAQHRFPTLPGQA